MLKPKKYAIFLILFLLVSGLASGCANGRSQPEADGNGWEEEVLYAKECGMDGLPCCLDKGQECFYGQQCCIDPSNPDRDMCADDCACGRKNSFCCADEPRCGEGLACFAGYCVDCGSISDPCCNGEEACQGDLVCHKGLCSKCGIPGNPCCQTGIACVNQEKRDSSRTECRNGLCVYCGNDSKVACRFEPECNGSHLLNNGYCHRCGGPNQPCCNESSGSDYVCDPRKDLVCELGFCTVK